VLLLVVLTLAPVVSEIPLAALAGVLIATATRMVEVSSLRALVRSTHGDAAVLLVTAALDATAASVLVDIVRGLEHRDVTVLVSGLPARFHGVLAAHGLHDELRGGGHLFSHTSEAIAHARQHLRDLAFDPVPA
jgi:SulP family sulfate permease